jgi:small ligand-binding sensory domain FIST
MTDMDAPTATRFAAAAATGQDWGTTTKACLDRLGNVAGSNLGFLYLTDGLADDAGSILTLLRAVTGIRDWVGTIGLGICASGEEYFDQPAMAVMAAYLPPEQFHTFGPVTEPLTRFDGEMAEWLARQGPIFGLIHGDPRHPQIGEIIPDLAEAANGFLVGGLTSSRSGFSQFAGYRGGDAIVEKGVSGVLFSPELPVATGLTQGCSPIGPMRTVTRADGNVLFEIDGRPALDVFKEDIGELLARDLRRVAGYIFAALPIPGSDTGDYLVRNLVGIDLQHKLIAIGDTIEPGQRILFTRRDRAAAQTDLEHMLSALKRRIAKSPRGAVYVSCLARGPNLFGDDSEELKTIREALGDVPLVGFFANGEISNNRLYGYTGVLTLFL